MANAQPSGVNDGGESSVWALISDHKAVSSLVAFVAVIAVTAVIVDLLVSATIAALILAWGFFLLIVIVVFALVPYYAIGLLGYRHR